MKKINDQIQDKAYTTKWEPETQFSVFAQPDKDFYLSQEAFFIHKYKVLHCLTSILQPKSIVELGVCGGSGADALLSGVDYKASYHGFDRWEHLPPYEEDGQVKHWDRYGIVKKLFKARAFTNYKLTQTETRDIDELPYADLIVVDAAHDYRNCYWDLRLAIAAKPRWIYVDDQTGTDVPLATKDFIKEFKDQIEGFEEIEQVNGGCLIWLKK